MLDSVIKLLKALNSDANPWSMATGIACGMILGLTPIFSVHNLLLLALVFSFRVHLASFWVSVAMFGLGFPALAPLTDQIGNSLLGNAELAELWTSLYQIEFWRLTRFNHARLLGGLVLSMALWLPVVVISYLLIRYYRSHWAERLKKTRLVSLIQSSRLVMIFNRGGTGS